MLPSLRLVAPLFCAAGLLLGSAGCASDDDGELLGQDESPSTRPDGGGKDKADAGAGRKDASTGGDAKVGKPDAAKPMDEGCGSVRAEAQLERGPVDIVLALDSSGSMASQICNVSTNLTAFAAGVGDNARVVSVYQMGVLGLTTAILCGNPDPLAVTPLAMDANRYLHRAVDVDSWNALTRLVGEYDSYKDFLRPRAPTHFIVVSDDASDPLRGGMLAPDFKAQMEAKLGHPFIFHAIVADGKNGCRGSGLGTEYLTLADQTGGEKLPICATDWTVLFNQLQAAVVNSAPIPCDFEIPPSPQSGTVDTDAVQVVFTAPNASEEQFPRATSQDKCGDQTAWYYNDANAPTRVQLCPAACEAVKQGGDVNIAFGCAPVYAL